MAGEGTALQERSTGGRVKSLIIVARDRMDQWQALTEQFAADEDIVILLDRRQAERRQAVEPYSAERRRGPDRRSWPSLEEDVRLRQYVIIRPKRQRFDN